MVPPSSVDDLIIGGPMRLLRNDTDDDMEDANWFKNYTLDFIFDCNA
jgi:hypothetical protein